MEYLGLLSLGAAIAAVALRCTFTLKETADVRREEAERLSPRARRVQQAAIVRRLLRYHRGLSQA